jgi:hypothetical protein
MGALTVGTMYDVLPVGYTVVYVEGLPYYYYGGNYYQQSGTQYRVIVPPVGATVSYLPKDAKTVVIDGVTYFVLDTIWYRRYFDVTGAVAYKVVKSPLGSGG